MASSGTGGSLCPGDGRALLRLAREGLRRHLRLPAGPEIAATSDPAILDQRRGVFASLHVDGQLRGCVGMVDGLAPLREAVTDAAVAAASRDSRFAPIEAREWPGLRLEISVLTAPIPASGPGEIRVGEHGLIVRKGPARGLLLPQVAVEQRWSAEEFLAHTCLKAGLAADAWRGWARGEDATFRVEVFAAEVVREAPD